MAVTLAAPQSMLMIERTEKSVEYSLEVELSPMTMILVIIARTMTTKIEIKSQVGLED